MKNVIPRNKPAISNNQRILGVVLTLMLLMPTVTATTSALPPCSAAVHSERYRDGAEEWTYGICELLPNNSTLCSRIRQRLY